MQLDNILILGDSFCLNRDGWPQHFINKVQHLDSNSYVHGIPGAGWWLIRKHFLPFADKNSVFHRDKSLLIYIHTIRDRLFNSDQEVCQTQPKPIDRNDDELTLAVSLYHKYIADNDFQIWAQDQWFKEFNELAGQFGTVINLFFCQEQHGAHPLIGITVPTPLLDVVNYERDGNIDSMAYDGPNGFVNHFSPENNVIFADQLFDIVTGAATDFDLSQFSKTTLHLGIK